MKYNKLISESLQKVELKKIRIKVDPANVAIASDLADCNGYEGYVLAEDATGVKVLVVIPGSGGKMAVINVPVEHLDILLQNLDSIKMQSLKQYIITALDVADGDPILQQIATCESLDDIEVFLRDRGVSTEDITDLYKRYITNG